MKKSILVLCIISAFIPFFKCNAKVVSSIDGAYKAHGNAIMASAYSVSFDDTIVINGYSYAYSNNQFYYSFQVPYNGTLTIKIRTEGPSKTEDNILYKVKILRDGEGGANYSVKFDSASTTSPSQQEINTGCYQGKYYLCIEGNGGIGYWKDYPSWNTYITFEFECSHIETKEVTVKEATCDEYGKTEERCTDCKEVISTGTIAKLPHTPAEEWVTTKEVSCASDGEKKLYCTVCNEDVDTEIIEALPHTYSEWTQDKETSCSEPGKKSRICADCNYKDTEEIEQLEHSYGEWKTEVEATCSEKGKRSRICSVCQYKAVEVIDKLDHKFGKWTTTEEASCTKEGERERVCENCEHTETEKVDKTSHKFSKWTTTLEATESRQGKRTRTCSICKETETDIIDRLECGNEYEWETYTNATCTSNGTMKKICSYCGKILSTKSITATGHQYSEWETTKIPTKTADGTEIRYCDICNKSESRSIKLTHGDYGTWQITKEATCKETGVKSFICDCCGKATKTQNIPKNEHSYSPWNNIRHASPERKGYRSRTCSLCGETETNEPEYDFEVLKKETEVQPPFTDVFANDWFKPVVSKCYHYKLMVGNSASTFNPNGNITVAEVITSAVRIFCLLNPDENKPEITAEPWYQGYVDYAIDKRIIKLDDFADYNAPATRAQMAYIFANAATDKNLKAINNYTELPDVSHNHKYSKEIFSLYNAGILTGNDAQGTFYPENNITRAEAAAIIARISEISDRVKK